MNKCLPFIQKPKSSVSWGTQHVMLGNTDILELKADCASDRAFMLEACSVLHVAWFLWCEKCYLKLVRTLVPHRNVSRWALFCPFPVL